LNTYDRRSDFVGHGIALVTKHGKERVIAPLVREQLGCALHVIDDVDTDTLGTFTREIPRAGTQREAAVRKARMAHERGHRFGLGSEGAFLPGPLGLGAVDVELLVFVDAEDGTEVLGKAHEPGRHLHGVVSTFEELLSLAQRAGFPEHGLVLRSNDEEDLRIYKGLRTNEDLHAAFVTAQREAHSGLVFVENDLRAHQNPTRMTTIARAARDLIERLASLCPVCGSPGFGHSATTPGLPCRWCEAATREPIADVYACVRCPHRESRPRHGEAFADPGLCDLCNP
jgi:hypothetical protein